MELFPKGEALDRVVDKVVGAGLWLGGLITRRHVHNEPSEHFVHPPNPIHLNRYEDEEYEGQDKLWE